ncbi:uncharacterized protein [Bos indicus]|nr:uncharacterized protein LOC100295995 [Bos taurus]XP_059744766.1 uncharacterized protein LOC100295995 [Bos taurus]XP_061279913.1 uncharacterized protein LOC133251448 isoform X3 [Bos javanicus]
MAEEAGIFHRLDNMSFFSSWIKAILIIGLAFPLYCETAFVPSGEIRKRNVTCIRINYTFAQKKKIQSVQRMAKHTPINAISAVKS